jgi:hypothetical protein
MALVSAAGGDYVVNATPQMSGEVMVDNQVLPLQQYVQAAWRHHPAG